MFKGRRLGFEGGISVRELFLELIQLPFLLIGQRFAVASGEVHSDKGMPIHSH